MSTNDDETCAICDGGPGNNCRCTCPLGQGLNKCCHFHASGGEWGTACQVALSAVAQPAEKPAGGTKHDDGKVPLALLPFDGLTEVGKVLQFGAKKYAPDNWRGGFTWRRLISATLRHVFAFAKGEDVDPETGISHLAHAICCLLFLLEHQLHKLGTDDRYRKAVAP